MIDAGIYCPDVNNWQSCDIARRCPKCNSTASAEWDTLNHWMAGRLCEVMKRTCSMCRFQWLEPLIEAGEVAA